VPLLTFIGNIDLDKSIENEQVIEKGEGNRKTQKKKGKGFGL
jgi:hypothetical protein